jgi:hypothetical protein
MDQLLPHAPETLGLVFRQLLTDIEEKRTALYRISEQLIAGWWDEVRAPNEKELKATAVLRFTIKEASAKMRQGPPADDEADMSLPVWAGVLPVALAAEAPEPDAALASSVAIPECVVGWGRKDEQAKK